MRLPIQIWRKLKRRHQLALLWRARWLFFRRCYLLRYISWRTPPPVRFALKSVLVSFVFLSFLPPHPGSIPVAMAGGLTTALATH